MEKSGLKALIDFTRKKMFPVADKLLSPIPEQVKIKLATKAGWEKDSITVHHKDFKTGITTPRVLSETWIRRDPKELWTEFKNFQDKIFWFITKEPKLKTPAQVEEEFLAKARRDWLQAQIHKDSSYISTLTFEQYYEKVSMEAKTRDQRRHPEKFNEAEVLNNSKRMEFYLKNAVQSYTTNMNDALAEHVAKGHVMPYDGIQVEYNIMQGFVPLTAIEATVSPEELKDLPIIKNEEGLEGVQAAYIRMDKLLHLTQETILKNREQAVAGVALHPMLNLEAGIFRQGLYSSMVPIKKGTSFLKAKYRLIEEMFHHFVTMGLERQEMFNLENAKREEAMKREDVQRRVAEVDEIFSVSKGGLNAEAQEKN